MTYPAALLKILLVQPNQFLILLLCSFPNLFAAHAQVAISGELQQWHKTTLTLAGPAANETDTHPNPFTDYRFNVTFRHESGSPVYRVPGYFAADGRAAESSSTSGNQWRAHFSPDKTGEWIYSIAFAQGKLAALDDHSAASPLPAFNGLSGSFHIAPTAKSGRDFRAKGRLEYVGRHHLRFAGTGEFFLKAGPDAPENLFAYADFDGTEAFKKPGSTRAGEAAPLGLHRFEPHLRDWQSPDPTWKNGKGKGLIGALNYISSKGCNSFSFLTYNAGGDGDDVWPFIRRDDPLHYDCSKLDQWQIVLDHAQARGLHAHFKMQEQENDDNRRDHKAELAHVPTALNQGDLGPERKLYCRELVARFGYLLALNWNLGEENTQSTAQQKAMAAYIKHLDPYPHPIVVHTFPQAQDQVYSQLLGPDSPFTGASLQNSWSDTHQRTFKWVTQSAHAGKPWVVANDEQNPADMGSPPDPGYAGHDGNAVQAGKTYTLHDIRKYCLWGNLTAGGAGVEYYFGYKLPQNDLVCEDWRSRDQSWDYCRLALDFFQREKIPFWDMANADSLIGNPAHNNTKYCLALKGRFYVIYLPTGGTTEIDLDDQPYHAFWFNPRSGGALIPATTPILQGPGKKLSSPPPTDPSEDWVLLLKR